MPRSLYFALHTSEQRAMPKVMFWNVQRVGAGAHEQKVDFVADVATAIMRQQAIDYVVFCEITSDIDMPEYGITFEKDGTVRKRGARAGAAQLGYACLARHDHDFEVHPLVIEDIAPVSSYFHHPQAGNPLKGGAQFGAQGIRNVVRITGTNVFAFHNNASSKAPSVLSWVAAHLQATYPDRWVLVGDLNCSPPELGAKFQTWRRKYHSPPTLPKRNWWTTSDPGPTHNAKGTLANLYDWVLHATSVGQVDVRTPKRSHDMLDLWRRNSDMVPDHLPVWLTAP